MKNITFSIKLAGILLLGVLCFFFLNVGAEAEEDADTTFEMVEGASVRKVVPYGIKYTAKVGKGLYSSGPICTFRRDHYSARDKWACI